MGPFDYDTDEPSTHQRAVERQEKKERVNSRQKWTIRNESQTHCPSYQNNRLKENNLVG